MYAAALLTAHLLEWADAEYERAAAEALKHLVHGSRPARRLLESLEERGSTVEHDEPWEPNWTEPNLDVVDGPGESVQTREWALKLRETAVLEEHYSKLEDEQLLELRVWLDAAEQPADAMPCAATAIYAGLYAYLLAPDEVAAWLELTADHPSRLVADARATMEDDASTNLMRWRALAEKAMALPSPTRHLAHVELDPLMAQLLHTHGGF